MSMLGKFVSTLTRFVVKTPQIQPVRYRYHEELREKGYNRRFGYTDKFARSGVIPHYSGKGARKLKELPTYKPRNVWNERRALFGQNDYIDILGNDNIHPTKILYKLPHWVRGAGGNEYKMLLRKRNVLATSKFPIARPSKWRDINKRIKHLFRYYNQKHPQSGMSPD